MARVVYVLRPSQGGAFKHVSQLCDALTDLGHEVFVAGPLSEQRDQLRATVVPLPVGRRISPASDARSLARLGRELRRIKPDLIHAHGSKGGVMGRLGRLAVPSTPLVFTPHLYAFDNYFARPQQRRVYEVIERALAPLATQVIGVCEREADLAAHIGSAGRTRVVHNGVEPVRVDEVHTRVAVARSRGPVICAIAELRESKGVLTLLEAMPQVRESIPDVQLVIAGDGRERGRVERMIGNLHLTDTVTLLGETSGPDTVMAGADLFVNPAYAEAFPYTVIEAMSAGLPIVATDVGGTGEAIGDAECGLLVTPFDTDALATAIVDLLTDAERREKMAVAAREGHALRFTTERMVASVLDVYAELIPGFGAPPNGG